MNVWLTPLETACAFEKVPLKMGGNWKLSLFFVGQNIKLHYIFFRGYFALKNTWFFITLFVFTYNFCFNTFIFLYCLFTWCILRKVQWASLLSELLPLLRLRNLKWNEHPRYSFEVFLNLVHHEDSFEKKCFVQFLKN